MTGHHPWYRPGPEFARGSIRDEGATLLRVARGEEIVERNLDVSVVCLPVGEAQLLRLEDGVGTERGRRIEPLVVESVEYRETLQQGRTLAPGPRPRISLR